MMFKHWMLFLLYLVRVLICVAVAAWWGTTIFMVVLPFPYNLLAILSGFIAWLVTREARRDWPRVSEALAEVRVAWDDKERK